jgi:hypothetical protein
MKLTPPTFARNSNLPHYGVDKKMRNGRLDMKKILSGIAILGIVCQSVPAWAGAGTEGASFLDIPVGAGPAALGSAYTALATNAYAPVWNPAGLGMLSGNEMAAQHVSYLESMHYEFLSFVHPFDKSRDSDTHRGIGASVQYLGSGDITRTDINPDGSFNANTTGSFSSYFAAYNLSYGQTVTDKLALGITGKLINAKIDDVSASAYAADVAGLYKVNDKAQLAASVVNAGTQLKFLSEGDSLPLALKVGGAYEPSSHYLGTADVVFPKNTVPSLHMGAQWRPLEAVSLRMGYKTDTLKGLSPIAGFTAGLGLHFMGQEFAYAWAPYGDLGDAQYFSLLVRFGAEEEQKRNLIRYNDIKKHRTVQNGEHRNELEPEYQQLMQLLSDDDSHLARTNGSSSTIDR